MTRGSYFRRAREGVVLFLLFALPLVLSPLGYQYIKEVFVLAIVSFLVILWAVEIFVKGEENIRIPLPLLGGLLLLAMASLSLIHSGNPLIGQESFGLLLFFLLFYLLLVNIISSECQARRLLGALFLAGTLAAIYALMQYFGFDLLPYPHRLSPAGPGSMVSTMGNKNYLAGFLSYLFLPALILLLKSRGWWRLAIFISLGVIYTTILASGTRGAWLGLAVAIFFLAMGLLSLPARRSCQAEPSLAYSLSDHACLDHSALHLPNSPERAI
ncbi:hypothetical protein GWN63_05280, partial [Candidatus Bathyarchaeota archaeon]|nr:hypothetical protein [Desulfobacterales bacterium]NIU81636.1 hypothetical protein [Candidatus Bathyarchaeota archaeon]